MKTLKFFSLVILSVSLYSCSGTQNMVPIDTDVLLKINTERCLNLEARMIEFPHNAEYYTNEISLLNNFQY